ncbi:MAG: YqaJ viral recombinase family protein [Rhodoferax sp.]|nr:YqaJ viral recombinase family protein [Rhodoferax sp.]
MKTHNLIQGSQAWHDYRANHFNASDAPAMLGLSPYKSRSELLHELATGQTPDVDPATQRRFDDGHRFEALARPLAEKIIGKDLYPVTGSEGKLSASFDGLTMAEDTAFEHKTLNEALRYTPWDEGNGDHLPPQYKVQMEQQLLVSGAERVLFMASKWKGDELVEERHCWYTSDPAIRAQIVSGWEQFAKDLAAYVPPEVIVPAKAAPQMGLPAVSIQVTGSIALIDNLAAYGNSLTAYIERINKKPETDQDFADLEATVKTLKSAEEALDAAEAGALAQTESIDAMRKAVALYRETARSNRLLVEKLVKAEKENRRNKLLTEAAQTLRDHIKGLNEQIGKPYMPEIQADFQGVIKGLKSLDSMKDKLDTEVASAKIAANEAAARIGANLVHLVGFADYAASFPDVATLVQKSFDDFTAVVAVRVAAAKEDAAKREAAQAAKPAPLVAPAVPNVTHEAVVNLMPATVRKAIAAPAPAATSEPTLKLGEISERLGFTLTADFLKVLGFEATNVKAAKLFHEEDFPAICQALITHISEVCEQFDAVSA